MHVNEYADAFVVVLLTNETCYNNLAERLVNNGYGRVTQGYNHLNK